MTGWSKKVLAVLRDAPVLSRLAPARVRRVPTTALPGADPISWHDYRLFSYVRYTYTHICIVHWYYYLTVGHLRFHPQRASRERDSLRLSQCHAMHHHAW